MIFFEVQHEIFFLFMQPWIYILKLRGLQILQSQKIFNLETALVFIEYHILFVTIFLGGGMEWLGKNCVKTGTYYTDSLRTS